MSDNKSGRILQRVSSILDLDAEGLADVVDADGASVALWLSGQTPLPKDLEAVLEELCPSLDTMERVQTELNTVRSLVNAVNDKIVHLSSFDMSDVQVVAARGRDVFGESTPSPLAPGRNRQRVSDYEILRRQAYGRLVRVRDLKSNIETTYRIAWGAESWGPLKIWSRSGPTISKLMPAHAGQIVDLGRGDDSRECEILEVTLLDRHPPAQMKGNYGNFARLEHARDRAGTPRDVVLELESWMAHARQNLRDALGSREFVAELEESIGPAPLTIDSKAALGDRFFMDPLEAQEEVMGWPEDGYALVEGVAGSGKTSVALGRSARLCIVRDSERVLDFTPANGVGFVLSEQLVGYLEGLRSGNLNLEKMPVKSYFRLRQELMSARQILSKGVRRVGAESEAIELVIGKMVWADAVESRMGPRIARALFEELPDDARATLPKPSPGVQSSHWASIAEPWAGLRHAIPTAFGRTPSLGGSLESVDRVRGEFAAQLEHLHPWNSPRFRDDRRKINQWLRDAIIRVYDYAGRYFEVIGDDGFSAQIRKGGTQAGIDMRVLDAALEEARERAWSRSLSNGDIDCLLLIAHRAAIGYRGRDGAQPIEHLRETDYRTHVFIDEVQDFNEVQVRLMLAQADPKYRCVTAVGDFSQRLSASGIASIERSGLGAGRSIFLGFNKRQTAPLHALSLAFRMAIQGEQRDCVGEPPRKDDEKPFLLGSTEAEVRGALGAALVSTRETHPSFSMAVLCPTGDRARELEADLHEDLWARNILSRVSDRADASKLCDAFHVHFTTPLQSKGLEFDAVFVIDTDAYDMRVPTDQAALYVALSRACRRLGVAYRAAPSGTLARVFQQHLATLPTA